MVGRVDPTSGGRGKKERWNELGEMSFWASFLSTFKQERSLLTALQSPGDGDGRTVSPRRALVSEERENECERWGVEGR